MADQRGVHGLLGGRAVRILLDSGVLDGSDVARRLSRALSLPDEAPRAAAWLEGFLTGDASLLLHDPGLLGVLDDWVAAVRGPVFDEVLPVLRRTFATFPPRTAGPSARIFVDWSRAAATRPPPTATRSTGSGPRGCCPDCGSCWACRRSFWTDGCRT